MYNCMAFDIKDGDMDMSLREVIKPHYTWLIQSQIHFSVLLYQSKLFCFSKWLRAQFISYIFHTSLQQELFKWHNSGQLEKKKNINFLDWLGRFCFFITFSLLLAFFLGSIQKKKKKRMAMSKRLSEHFTVMRVPVKGTVAERGKGTGTLTTPWSHRTRLGTPACRHGR